MVLNRMDLIRKNTVEIVSEADLGKLLKGKKKPVVYCGYEPSGPLHLGHFVTILKLMDLQKAGFKVKILLADVHALLNKLDEDKIKKEIVAWKKTLKAIGLKADVVLGSSFQFGKSYQMDVMRVARKASINRGLRSMQEIARDVKNASISQLWYPLMQVVDIKYLGADVALGGMEQRKVHMMAKDVKYNFVALHTPLITSLRGAGSKMSSSIKGSGVSVVDSEEDVEKAIKNAYCPIKETKDNPIVQICQLIVFPKLGKLKVKRPAKFGGDMAIGSYEKLERLYSSGKLHPMDLKVAVFESLEKIIAPIRKNFR